MHPSTHVQTTASLGKHGHCGTEHQGGTTLEVPANEHARATEHGKERYSIRFTGLFGLCTSLTFVIGGATTARAQSPEPQTETRQTTIVNAVEEKSKNLYPYPVTPAEK